MKKILFVFLLLTIGKTQACDICGCVNSNASIGAMASNRYNWLGMQSAFRNYQSFAGGIRHSKEVYWRNELMLRWNILDRVQLLGWIPYQKAWQLRDLGQTSLNGWGDVQGMLNVVLLDNRSEDLSSRQFIAVGWLIKAPTGKSTDFTDAYRNLYPGTGSWDQTLISQYSVSCGYRQHLQSEMSYSIKGKSSDGFRNGNVFQCSAWWVRSFDINRAVFLSSFGGVLEQFNSASSFNQSSDQVHSVSGNVISVKGGCFVIGRKGIFSCQLQLPVYQNLNQQQIRQRFTLNVGYQFLINQKHKKNEN